MKKNLIALAILGAFSGAALAQSNVTLYGIIDVGYQYTDPDVSGVFGRCPLLPTLRTLALNATGQTHFLLRAFLSRDAVSRPSRQMSITP